MFEIIQGERAFAVINGLEMELNSQTDQEATLTITALPFPHLQPTFPLNSIYFSRQIFLRGQIWLPNVTVRTIGIWIWGT